MEVIVTSTVSITQGGTLAEEIISSLAVGHEFRGGVEQMVPFPLWRSWPEEKRMNNRWMYSRAKDEYMPYIPLLERSRRKQ